jgi:hypothetical protein
MESESGAVSRGYPAAPVIEAVELRPAAETSGTGVGEVSPLYTAPADAELDQLLVEDDIEAGQAEPPSPPPSILRNGTGNGGNGQLPGTVLSDEAASPMKGVSFEKMLKRANTIELRAHDSTKSFQRQKVMLVKLFDDLDDSKDGMLNLPEFQSMISRSNSRVRTRSLSLSLSLSAGRLPGWLAAAQQSDDTTWTFVYLQKAPSTVRKMSRGDIIEAFNRLDAADPPGATVLEGRLCVMPGATGAD